MSIGVGRFRFNRGHRFVRNGNPFFFLRCSKTELVFTVPLNVRLDFSFERKWPSVNKFQSIPIHPIAWSIICPAAYRALRVACACAPTLGYRKRRLRDYGRRNLFVSSLPTDSGTGWANAGPPAIIYEPFKQPTSTLPPPLTLRCYAAMFERSKRTPSKRPSITSYENRNGQADSERRAPAAAAERARARTDRRARSIFRFRTCPPRIAATDNIAVLPSERENAVT